jgi:hypothetical protein
MFVEIKEEKFFKKTAIVSNPAHSSSKMKTEKGLMYGQCLHLSKQDKRNFTVMV